MILTRAYWEIGKRIVTVEQKNNIRAQYGEALVERLSQYLTRKYGGGFSATNLRYMRRFYIAYPIQQAPAELDWTRYQILSTIEDKNKRQAYERKTIKESWSSRGLAARLRADGVSRLFFSGRRAKRFVEKLLKPCPFIVVKTYKDQSDKYARYLVEVFFKPGETDPAVVAARGEYLNQRLLDEGLAQGYKK